ncbi:MAG TPA: nickel transporter [Saliniramus sp.]|nr:nickel transporter [Saliniramus sp.]
MTSNRSIQANAAEAPATLSTAPGTGLRRLVVAVIATLLVAGTMAAIVAVLFPAPPPTPRAPFGMTMREAAPQASGFGAFILAMQGAFYQHLQAAVSALKDSGAAIWTLVAIGFGYGVFHAAGPGHGKAVISAYLVANERALAKGLLLCLAAALLQAFVAIAIVLVALGVFTITAAGMDRITGQVEIASFAAVALLGLFVTWRKAGSFLAMLAMARGRSGVAFAESCDHAHLPPPEAIERMRNWREIAGVVFAAGVRPCAGALVILVFSASQGLLWAGIAATFAMALGTAVTTGAIATMAVFMKQIALRVAGGRGARAAVVTSGIELLAGAFVLVVGLALLFGMLSAGIL